MAMAILPPSLPAATPSCFPFLPAQPAARRGLRLEIPAEDKYEAVGSVSEGEKKDKPCMRDSKDAQEIICGKANAIVCHHISRSYDEFVCQYITTHVPKHIIFSSL